MTDEIKALYELWCANATEDADLSAELKSIAGDEEAIIDRFYRNLEFGTGGLRGVIGAGAYRMNIYTVRRATQGLADYVNGDFENGSVAISYDSRIKSDVFAKAAASVLVANGIKVYIYKELMPTPMLSYAVRYFGCSAGIMVTASHNPAKYNGYKVYGSDGCQITLDVANTVIGKIGEVPMFGGAKVADFDKAVAEGKIVYIDDKCINDYLDEVRKQGIHTDLVADSGLKVVYTPLNGTGNKPVRAILKQIGVKEVTVVPEQENPDGNFPTCPFPNPEIKEALAYGLKLCETVKPDLLLATDPDCDRVGIAVPSPDGDYVLFSGNETGALLMEYVCSERKALGTMPERPVAVKTIVSTDICKKMAEEYGVELREVLTGFKFIGEQIGFLEADGEADRYIFGFEESYGYLSGSYVRDKDAVVASMLICEMAAFYRTKGISLLDARDKMYAKYGNYKHSQESFVCEGASGMERMKEIMSDLRTNTPAEIGGLKVEKFGDYLASTETNIADGKVTPIELPKSDVLAFRLEQDASVIIRPSGTEPKIKAYYTTIGETREAADAQERKLAESFKKILGF
ncbi:phosphoglucomutase [Ruminococcus sp. YE71]|uniref:phospho-sugar mutase n=1 Tax=unclassified Ruminococcus TaxID=2608920 RepID=UPI0008894007|nr:MULTISPECIES: phospho-sugar mutase [unclassified Ruminococcus]SDA21737.1 phosphoglucomutase [Ruminococcus sp. YE78]SFW36809.1 phosphoglucomutase [Ruminococcus sp. YE71]